MYTSPVYDAIPVKELEPKDHTGGVEAGSRLFEHVLMNMHHEIATTCILHHKTYVTLRERERLAKSFANNYTHTHMHLCLETGV